jgi:tRNA(fMet)-specific endonuclease VapC
LGLVVDTSVLIGLERSGYAIDHLSALTLAEPVALSTVTASELLVGVERADTEERRERRSAFVESALASIPLLPIDLEVARVHARLAAALLVAGQLIGAHDLLVAATAIRAGYGVLTNNVVEFERVPGLTVVRATL